MSSRAGRRPISPDNACVLMHCGSSVHRVLMESHSNDSRDSGHHWWHPSFSNITPHHRRPVLLSAAGKTGHTGHRHTSGTTVLIRDPERLIGI